MGRRFICWLTVLSAYVPLRIEEQLKNAADMPRLYRKQEKIPEEFRRGPDKRTAEERSRHAKGSNPQRPKEKPREKAMCKTELCPHWGRRGWAKGFCVSCAHKKGHEEAQTVTKRSHHNKNVKKTKKRRGRVSSANCEDHCEAENGSEKAKEAKEAKEARDFWLHEAGGEVCEEAHAAGSEEAKEAEDQEEAGDEELQCAWFKMCLDINKKRACEETIACPTTLLEDDVEEDPLACGPVAEQFVDDGEFPGQIVTVCSPCVCRWARELARTAFDGWRSLHYGFQKKLTRTAFDGRRTLHYYGFQKKKSKQAHLRGLEQEAQDWAIHFSDEWDFSLDLDQNLSHGL